MTDEPQIEMRRCSKGDDCVHPDGCWQPNDAEHFWQGRQRCKACKRDRERRYRAENIEKRRASVARSMAKNREKYREYAYQYYLENREARIAYAREWKRNNAEHTTEYMKQYRESNRLRARTAYRAWVRANREYIRSRMAEWSKNNRHLVRVTGQRRRARKRSLPDTLTPIQWQRALDYFNGCCAVCGRQLNDLFGTRIAAMDHWIPLVSDECPGTIALNCVPLCHGENGCNNSKKATPPADWLNWKFGSRQGALILTRIEAYFTWVKEQDNIE